jgi:phosphoserine phosphatase RsbU/P
MTGTESPDTSSLPFVARTLVDLYRELNPAAEPAVVRATDAGISRVYPPAGTVDAAGLEQYHLFMVDGAQLRLQVRSGTVTPEVATRLADAITRSINADREARSSAQELSDRYEEINLLYSISEILGSVRSFEEAAERILAEVMDVIGARRASLWVHKPETDTLELAAAVGEDGLRGPIRPADADSATAWVFREKQTMNVERAPGSGSASLRPRPRSGEAFLSVPINYTPPRGHSRTVGVLTLVGRRMGIRFSTGDERLLAAIASQIGAAIESQRLLQESLRQERMLREMELAHDLQLKLLPDPVMFDGGPEIAARCQPADSVGGDFFQLYRLSGDRLGILIGDVSSHGFSAALIMALTMSAIGIYVKEEETPGEVLRRVHRALIKELESTEMYLSLFYGVLDRPGARLDYANAGHPQAYRVDASSCITRLGATGTPLGTVSSEDFGQESAPWNPDDMLVLFTDGLSDSLADRLGSMTGESRLVDQVVQRREQTLQEIVDWIFDESDHHPTSEPDDRTLVLVRA